MLSTKNSLDTEPFIIWYHTENTDLFLILKMWQCCANQKTIFTLECLFLKLLLLRFYWNFKAVQNLLFSIYTKHKNLTWNICFKEHVEYSSLMNTEYTQGHLIILILLWLHCLEIPGDHDFINKVLITRKKLKAHGVVNVTKVLSYWFCLFCFSVSLKIRCS